MVSFLKRAAALFRGPTIPSPTAPVSTFEDLSAQELEIMRTAQPLTLTSPERLASLIGGIKYVVQNDIIGDIAECGVWRGGSMVATALTLQMLGDTRRDLYLYDTFEGMSSPTEHDRDLTGESATKMLNDLPHDSSVWAIAGLETVKANLLATGYPPNKIHFVRGKVEETIPATMPKSLSLLRLDTDWYESTRHELCHLFPLLSQFGVLLIDDYGHWQGARKAVDEFVANLPHPMYLHRIDYTGRLAIKY